MAKGGDEDYHPLNAPAGLYGVIRMPDGETENDFCPPISVSSLEAVGAAEELTGDLAAPQRLNVTRLPANNPGNLRREDAGAVLGLALLRRA